MEEAVRLQAALAALIPAPKRARLGRGRLTLPPRFRLTREGAGLEAAAEAALRLFPGASARAGARGPRLLALCLVRSFAPMRHRLEVGPRGVRVSGGSPEAVFHGVQTLRQWALLHPGQRLPELSVEDWPDFGVRGLSYDVSRGRVPTLESLLEMVDRLALLKVNQLQLYVEHTFRFKGHPLIGQGCSPLDAVDIQALDRACRERYIELVPSFACLGHMNRILELPPYRGLAEDLAEERYREPGFDKRRAGLIHLPPAWTLAPEAPGAMDLIRSLLDEYLPLFSSGKFNACCDEPFDLGRGQSYEAARSRGLMDVYLGHVRRLQEAASAHGKGLMIWGDMLRSQPASLGKLPRDITVLDWDYRPQGDFSRIRERVEAGYLAYAAPSSNSWGTFFPRLGAAMGNISSFARAGHEAGAVGLLNTEWGDGGHFNFLENSWLPLSFGAEAGWNASAEAAGFSRRFCSLFLGTEDASVAEALDRLGDLASWHRSGGVEYYLSEAFFGPPGSPVFSATALSDSVGEGGKVLEQARQLDAGLARGLADELGGLAARLAQARQGAGDPWGLLDYAHFGAEALAHGARKAEALPRGGDRRALAKEATRLRDRFEALWLARNRASEIEMNLCRMDVCIAQLGGEALPVLAT